MKKRVLAYVLVLALCAGLCPALAAEGEEVFQPGELWWYAGLDTLKISDDQGASYAELPGVQDYCWRTGLALNDLVMVTPLSGGGVRVEAQGQWYDAGEDRLKAGDAFRRDYSADEVARALAGAVPTPMRVLAADSGGVALGVREVRDTPDFDLAAEASSGQYFPPPAQSRDQLLRTADGVTWDIVDLPELTGIVDGWYDGSAFHVMGYETGFRSADGLSWTEEPLVYRPSTPLAADLGPYHFELVRSESPDAFGYEVYIMDKVSGDTGALLPHMGQGIRDKGMEAGAIQAWYGPDDTVFLAVYDRYRMGQLVVCINYPVSSLDWVLANQSVRFRTVEVQADNGTIRLGTGGSWYLPHGLLRDDGSGWKRVADVPWRVNIEVLPYNGKTFMVYDKTEGEQHLYVSVDGLSWTAVDTLRPRDIRAIQYDYVDYAFAWTGTEYIACREAAESQHGMMGSSGGWWYEGNTSVYFLNEQFQLTGSHDFGRLVQAVGFYDGAYYAQVANSDGGRYGWTSYNEDGSEFEPKAFNQFLGSTLYRSADGESWEALPDIYMDLEQIMVAANVPLPPSAVPTGDPAKPLRGVAQLDGWRFVLAEGTRWDYDEATEESTSYFGTWVYLLKDRAMDWVELPDLRHAILASYITPGELTARYDPDGAVRVTVTDLYTPSMECSVAYDPASLDWVKEHMGQLGYRAGEREEQNKPGVADIMLLELPNGERELLYRTPANDGQYMWYDSVPWSNSITLLPFSGKDFMVLDLIDGKVYISSDGVNWAEATGDWIVGKRQKAAPQYAMTWAGDKYLACCRMGTAVDGVFQGYDDPDSGKALFLNENLDLIGSYDFGRLISEIGYQDGVYYVMTGSIGWDEASGMFNKPMSEDAPVLWRSNDGVNWERFDAFQVRASLVRTR